MDRKVGIALGSFATVLILIAICLYISFPKNEEELDEQLREVHKNDEINLNEDGSIQLWRISAHVFSIHNKKSKNDIPSDIYRLSYNQHYIIAVTEMGYVVYDFKKDKIIKFDDLQQLEDFRKKHHLEKMKVTESYF